MSISVEDRRRLVVSQLLQDAEWVYRSGQHGTSWDFLAKAHVVSQPSARLHALVHWKMLLLALRTNDRQEIAGQIFRLIVAAPGSFLQKYPKGNRGTSDVSAFKKEAISTETQKLIDFIEKGRPNSTR